MMQKQHCGYLCDSRSEALAINLMLGFAFTWRGDSVPGPPRHFSRCGGLMDEPPRKDVICYTFEAISFTPGIEEGRAIERDCDSCDGSGECSWCDGTGEKPGRDEICPDCEGTGRCQDCKGTGKKQDE
jgi:hypothetical protein